MATIRTFRSQFDWPLFVALAILCVLGVTNLYSATSVANASREMYLLHIYWLTLGAAAAVLVTAVDYRVYERYAWPIYVGSIVLLILVFLLGRMIRGAQRWIWIGSFSLQPSELMKIGLIIALAKYLHNDPKSEGRTLRDLVVPTFIGAIPIGLVAKQPDLGTALVLTAIFFTIMFLTHLKLRSFLTLAAVFIASAPLTWTYLLRPYQRERFTAFLEPEKHLRKAGWHTYQSVVAVGSGGWTGKGFMAGTQNQHLFLPDQHSDFPFAVWAEERGFLGVLGLASVYLFLSLWSLRIASQAKDRFGAVCAVGVGAMLFWQATMNIGMVLGILPVVGVTLPLFSHGGSSVLTIMIGAGLLMNVSMRRFSF